MGLFLEMNYKCRLSMIYLQGLTYYYTLHIRVGRGMEPLKGSGQSCYFDVLMLSYDCHMSIRVFRLLLDPFYSTRLRVFVRAYVHVRPLARAYARVCAHLRASWRAYA